MSKHYMDVDTMQMTKPRKKDISYSVKKDGKYTIFKNREEKNSKMQKQEKFLIYLIIVHHF